MAKNELTGRPFPRHTAQVQRLITAIHVWFYQKTRGKIGHYIGKIPTLLLTTIGRKSGKQYVTPLTYARDGERLILIASNGGTAGDPQWWRNLQASAETTVQIGAQILRVRAAAAPPEQRDRLWAKALAIYPGYAEYQRKTARLIPVVVLQPLS